jgi:hypothetical protein
LNAFKPAKKQEEHQPSISFVPDAPTTNTGVPATIEWLPIEPPASKSPECREVLDFKNLSTYKQAVTLAVRYCYQAKLAVDRRTFSLEHLTTQLETDLKDTAKTYEEQTQSAHARHRAMAEQAHIRYRQRLNDIRNTTHLIETEYVTKLEEQSSYGLLPIRMIALTNAQKLITSLFQAYRSACGADATANLVKFLSGWDRTYDLTITLKTSSFMPLLSAILNQLNLETYPEEYLFALEERQASVEDYIQTETKDLFAPELRGLVSEMAQWLSVEGQSDLSLCLERLNRDGLRIIQQAQRQIYNTLENKPLPYHIQGTLTATREAYLNAQSELRQQEEVLKRQYHVELERLDDVLRRDIAWAEALVTGMDLNGHKSIEAAKDAVRKAKKRLTDWQEVVLDLESVSSTKKFVWRWLKGHNDDQFWVSTRSKIEKNK